MSPEAGIGASTSIVVTCEHAGHEVPEEYAELFEHAEEELKTHRGYDPGAIGVAIRLSALLSAPLFHTPITRLLVEANRSIGHPDLFSRFSRLLPDDEKQRIIDAYYLPHRTAVERTIDALIGSGRRVLHLGVHTFTDEWPGQDRAFELGLLFDPSHSWERELSEQWAERIKNVRPDVRVRINEPYLGTDDGLTTSLRTHHGANVYAGIEIELRQGFVITHGHDAQAKLLARSLLAD